MKTKEQIRAEIEVSKEHLADVEFANSVEDLAFKQGYIKALRWVLGDGE